MIKSITVTNYLGESITMELRFPEKSGFLVTKITGLGPSKANVNTTESASSDGATYNSARVSSRNIVFSIKLLGKPDIETTRQNTYKYFPIKKRVHLLIETDNRTCETYGYVEANEPDIFSSNESTQISILCPDPYLYSIGYVVTAFAGIEPEFSFPFENASVADDLINFGEIISVQANTVLYTGDAEVGFNIYIHALGEATNVTIYNTETYESMKIDTNKLSVLTGSGIIAGDDIIISTIKGQKCVLLYRNGEYINILNCLDKNTDWFQLSKGDNVFTFVAETGGNHLQFRMEHQSVYEGV